MKTLLFVCAMALLAGCGPSKPCPVIGSATYHLSQPTAVPGTTTHEAARRYWWRIGYAAALLHFRLHPPKPAHCVTHKQNTLCKAPNDVAIPAGP